jgi:signal transduction histidine kinase
VPRTNALLERSGERVRSISMWGNLPLFAAGMLSTFGLLDLVGQSGGVPSDISTGLALVLCTTVPLVFIRSHLLASAVTITSALLLSLSSGRHVTIAGVLAATAALYLVAVRSTPRIALLFAAPFVAYAIWPAESGAGGKNFAVLLLLIAVGSLSAGSSRRAGSEAAQRNAADWAYADTVLAYAARGERARIARELHDIVAHHISMISVQAETARLTTPGMPAEGAGRLLVIGDTARQALTEMRRLLGVLREDAAAEPTRRPQPGLDQLVLLADDARSAGSGVRLIIEGRVVPLDPGIELAAFRIVQEALTNARRHAPGAAVDVELHYVDGALHLRVRDSGPGAPPGAVLDGGHGLLGMRERAAMAGGTLRTSEDAAGGFVIEAVLPAPEAAQ